MHRAKSGAVAAKTSAGSFADSGLGTELRALAGNLRWDNTAPVTYYLEDNPSGQYAFDWQATGASAAVRHVLGLYFPMLLISPLKRCRAARRRI